MKSSAKHSDNAAASSSSASPSRSQSKRQSAAAASGHKQPQAASPAVNSKSGGGATTTSKKTNTVSPKGGGTSATTTTTASTSHASNQQASVNGSGAGGTAAPNSSKEKQSHYRNYAGFQTKSIRNIWEQHERHDMMDLAPDVLVRLAEDATYKQWELINHLKTYARHSGGNVTPDLLNEVLRHSDAAAILGAGTGPPWNQLETAEGNALHFPPDRILDLRDEYLRDVQAVQCAPLTLSCTSAVDPRARTSLARFSKALCVALLTGTHITCDYALHTAAIQPMVAAQLEALLRFCTRVLCTDGCSAVTFGRVIAFLGAVGRNPSVRQMAHNTNDAQWWHLVQLLVCAALGPVDLNVAVAEAQQRKRRWQQQQQQQKEQRQQHHDGMTIKVESGGGVVELDAGEQTTTSAAMESDDTSMFATAGPTDEIPPECEALLQMMEREDFNGIVKGGETEQMVVQIKEEPMEVDETAGAVVGDEEDYDNTNGDKTPGSEPQHEKFSKLTTNLCSDAQVEALLCVMAELAAIWGYAETEMIYVLSKRMEVYFAELETDPCATIDYGWLSRCVRLLWSLGDFAFRELIVYLPQIDPDHVPESVRVHFNPCAMYLRGRSDIFLYEYLHELCGDGLLPFLCYYSKYNQKHAQRRRRRWSADRNRALRIPVKLLLHRYPRLVRNGGTRSTTHAELFPDATGAVVSGRPKAATIKFAFAGSAPVLPKQIRNNTNNTAATFSDSSLLNQSTVICRRRLLRSYTQPKFHHPFSVIDYHRMVL